MLPTRLQGYGAQIGLLQGEGACALSRIRAHLSLLEMARTASTVPAVVPAPIAIPVAASASAPATATAPTLEPESYEGALAELDTLVQQMEGGQMPLDQLLAAYRRGADLLGFCRLRLQRVENQVQVLDDGQLKSWGSN